jgi:transportin-3
MLIMQEFCPDILFLSPSFSKAFRVVLSALTLYHPEIVRPAMEVVESLLEHPALRPISPSQPSIPTFPIFSRAIRAAIDESGFQLTGLILSGILDSTNSGFDQDESFSMTTIIFKRLAESWGALLPAWVSAALEQLPSSVSLGPDGKRALLVEFTK